MRSRTGYWKDKATQPPPVFGEKGTRLVAFTGELPHEHRGGVTQTLYVFTDKHPQLHIDLRDLPTLAKDVGRDQLRAVSGELPALEDDAKEPAEKDLSEEVDDGISDDGARPDA